MKTAIAIIAIIMMLVFSIPAWAWLDLPDAVYLNFSDDQKVLNLMEEFLKLKPGHEDALMIKTDRLFKMRKYEDVIQTIEDARHLAPEFFVKAALPYLISAHRASKKSNLILKNEVFSLCREMSPTATAKIYRPPKEMERLKRLEKGEQAEEDTYQDSDEDAAGVLSSSNGQLFFKPGKKGFYFEFPSRKIQAEAVAACALATEARKNQEEALATKEALISFIFGIRKREGDEGFQEFLSYLKDLLAAEKNNPNSKKWLKQIADVERTVEKHIRCTNHFWEVMKRNSCRGHRHFINGINTVEIGRDVSVSYMEGGDLTDVKLPVSVSNQLLKIAKAKGFKIDINLDLPFVAWFTKNIIGGSASDSPLALCYITALVRESQFNVLSDLIDLYLEDSNLKGKK